MLEERRFEMRMPAAPNSGGSGLRGIVIAIRRIVGEICTAVAFGDPDSHKSFKNQKSNMGIEAKVEVSKFTRQIHGEMRAWTRLPSRN
jgi:hypothetical protein